MRTALTSTLAMHDYEIYLLAAKVMWVFFVFCFGACVGSLINVLAYRMPLGLGVVTPPSRCPACETRLTWRENIPVLGWVLLRGRCRFCKSRISPEYPIVEAFVGVLFAGFFVLWYLAPAGAVTLSWPGSAPWSAVKPEWAMNDPWVSWPTFVVVLALLGSLVAMTLIDAKTFTIPLSLPWFATVVALVVHPVHAWWVQGHPMAGGPGGLRHAAAGFNWSIPTASSVAGAGWWWVGGGIGAVVGLGVSLLMMRVGLIGRSFADYAEWEAEALKALEKDAAAGGEGGEGEAAESGGGSGGSGGEGSPAEMWIQYPHARREMVRELAFLASPVLLGLLGGRLAVGWGGEAAIPLWLDVLSGVVMGYLIGGGVVWAVRIGGSLGLGREAMGLGDVHLMAAVGACVGWIDAVLAFFGAAFVGVFWAIGGRVFRGGFQRAMPYGPYLAVATVLVLLLKPLIEYGLTAFVFRVPPGSPPINLP